MPVEVWIIVMILGGLLGGSCHGRINVLRGHALRTIWEREPKWVEERIGKKDVDRLRKRLHAPMTFEGSNFMHSLLSSNTHHDPGLARIAKQYKIVWWARIVGIGLFLVGFLGP